MKQSSAMPLDASGSGGEFLDASLKGPQVFLSLLQQFFKLIN